MSPKPSQNNQKNRKRSCIAFKKALCSLLEEKSFSEIRVQDILKEADYSRSAFYSNYTDKYDFAKRIVDEEVHAYVTTVIRAHWLPATPCIEERKTERGQAAVSGQETATFGYELAQRWRSSHSEAVFQSTNVYFEHVYNNRDIYTAILTKSILPNITEHFCSDSYDLARKLYSDAPIPESDLRNRYASYSITCSYLFSIRFWISNNFAFSPLLMTELRSDLFALQRQRETGEAPED